jgi:2-polyprenyl-3-methyl-5-hydroxy-6-metoxy-1,4-benzoquinol methylase
MAQRTPFGGSALGRRRVILVIEDGVPPADARRAARRSRDAWLAGGSRAQVVESHDPGAAAADAKLLLNEPECAVAPNALDRAVASLSAGAPAVIPAGFYGARAAPEPYVTLWEFEAIARAARMELGPEPGLPPVELRLLGSRERARAAEGFFVHSFAGRRAHARPELASLVPSGARRVLDVGCGEGALGATLEELGIRVTGVEPDDRAARAAARRLSRVHPVGVESAWSELEGGFDTVIAADVLEHLEDPLSVLVRLRDLVAERGALVISVPNASNAAVLGGVLQGRWDPALEGIVADDHHTYAGRAGWARLLLAAGWQVERWSAIPGVGPRAATWLPALAAAGLGAEETSPAQWIGVARPVAARGSVHLGAYRTPPMDLDDPLGDARTRISSGHREVVRASNALFGGFLEPLFASDLAEGDARGALADALSERSLVQRFSGSATRLEIGARDAAPLPGRVVAALAAARALRLPTASDETFANRTLEMRFVAE